MTWDEVLNHPVYVHDTNPGSTSSLHEPEIPHMEKECPGLRTAVPSGLSC